MNKVFDKGIDNLLDFNWKILVKEGLKIAVDSWEKFDTNYNKNFKKYFETSIEKYNKVPTVLNDDRQELLSIYQESYLEYKKIEDNNEHIVDKDRVLSSSVENLLSISNYCWITGYGGIGKSTMLKYFFLTSIINSSEKSKIPVYIELRKYNYDPRERRGLLKFIYEEMKVLNFDLEYKYFENMVSKGRFLFLLDAFDEINSSYMTKFLIELDECMTSNCDNSFIISSRNMPKGNIDTVDGLKNFSTKGLTLEQAVSLIEKLKFYPNDLRNIFKEKLSESLFLEYESLAQNPILLMLMLRTFAKNSNFPKEKSSFLLKVFIVLYEEHDGSKLGGFKRELKTNCSEAEIRKLFSKFCYVTYFKYKGEKKEFSISEIKDILDKIISSEKIDVDISKILYDFSVCLCLIYKEGEKYYFVHNIFQEFYAAYCLYGFKQEEQKKFFTKSLLDSKTEGRAYNWRVYLTTFEYYKELDNIHKNRYFDENVVLPILEEIETAPNFLGYEYELSEFYYYKLINNKYGNNPGTLVYFPFGFELYNAKIKSRFLYYISSDNEKEYFSEFDKLNTSDRGLFRKRVSYFWNNGGKFFEKNVRREIFIVTREEENPESGVEYRLVKIPTSEIVKDELLNQVFKIANLYRNIEKLSLYRNKIENEKKEEQKEIDFLLGLVNY
ncbi:NACHT domain-containing protein [Pseudolactococcus reticulitermitis]|uniref:NACHT domain-containing protein n=1 Tax=Pseudolactococcus reticulitermitis TaxID=2025039 RepID=A0A224X0P7_9LACT|nr:hypothetical protein [Lactococcus reticulitermitis]GAX47819.1 hypothetical protein RsY01_1423 [Lactococcus reticulitermitis]